MGNSLDICTCDKIVNVHRLFDMIIKMVDINAVLEYFFSIFDIPSIPPPQFKKRGISSLYLILILNTGSYWSSVTCINAHPVSHLKVVTYFKVFWDQLLLFIMF